MSASEACHAAALALKECCANVQVIEMPMSDGGEGLVEAIKCNIIRPTEQEVQHVCIRAHDPLMNPIDAEYLISSKNSTAYMEMAETCGITWVPKEKRNPLITTTYGFGEMIADAIKHGVSHIVMGIGGSATNDAGMGMLEALQDAQINVNELPRITVACDVTNPLCGSNGASAVYGPQKGATPEMVQILDDRLRRFAEKTIAEGIASKEMMDTPGAGAAGGLGFGLMAYLGAELKSGIDILLDMVCFEEQIKDADLVITGEGKSDKQTLMGKVPQGILKRCKRLGVPVCLLSGAIDDPKGILQQEFQRVDSINEGDNRPLDILMLPDTAKQNIRKSIKRIVQCEHELQQQAVSTNIGA